MIIIGNNRNPNSEHIIHNEAEWSQVSHLPDHRAQNTT